MITGVVTQGSGLGTEWLKQVKVATSVGPLRTDLVYITTSSVQVSSTENEPGGYLANFLCLIFFLIFPHRQNTC